ncbi:thioesterase family protein [Yinghuangia sp. ASG 101]|uniref:thioesterase family protein n=1 Tax=Yinghuangia sp. ASG 101 TaxID=2896848 RepID=UPI001E5DCBDD|nr:thioesterase family protein [Yinghuangia sp. ASG 101]UGQ15018.1 thioesterase family protein [Yinghuangia sp. ASG 101]
MAGFAAATAVTPTATPAAPATGQAGDTCAHGAYALDLDPAWTIGGKPNGGYLLAAMARAALADAAAAGSAHIHPLAASANYVGSPDPGPAEVRVELLRTGRTVSQARARLLQNGRICIEANFTLGALDEAGEPWWGTNPPAPLPAPDHLVRIPPVEPVSGMTLPIMDEVVLELDPAGLGFAVGAPGGTGEFAGRVSFADGHPADPVALLFLADVLPPVTMDLGASGWMPTLQLTVYVRAVPAPGPLTIRHHARLIEAGLMDEVCEVWDARGRLVAQATQLASARLPEAGPAGGTAGRVAEDAPGR